MSITWGHMTDKEKLEAHAKFEQECLDAARVELAGQARSGIRYATRLIQRAQQIKTERLAERKQVTGVSKLSLSVDEVLERIHKGLQK